MELTTKLTIIVILVSIVAIIQFIFIRRKTSRKAGFPLLINGFHADFTAKNSLKVSYAFKHKENEYVFEPKASEHKRNSLQLNVEMKQNLDHFIKEFSLRFDVINIETVTEQKYVLDMNEAFTQLNLSFMTRFITDYLRANDPHIINQTKKSDESINENLMQ